MNVTTTPSQLYRLAVCKGSEALPQADSLSEFARDGIVFDDFLTNVRLHGREAALDLVEDDEDREAMEAVDLERLGPMTSQAMAAQVALAWDLEAGTARELGRNITRQQAREMKKPTEMVGILDIVGLTTQEVVVLDYKRGFGRVDRAEVNWQTRTYSLMASLAYGRDRALQGVIRAPKGLTPWQDITPMDELDLAAHEADVRALLAEVAAIKASGTVPPLVEGRHCTYCPARSYCPAKAALVKSLVGELAAPDGAERPWVLKDATPEQLARAWAMLGDAEKVVERLKSTIKDEARVRPIPLGDGYVLGEVEATTESIVPTRARAALEQLFGEVGGAIAGNATKTAVKLTKEALKREVGKLLLPIIKERDPRVTKTALERTVLEELRKAGAVSASTWLTVDERKIKEPKVAPKAIAEEPAAALPEPGSDG